MPAKKTDPFSALAQVPKSPRATPARAPAPRAPSNPAAAALKTALNSNETRAPMRRTENFEYPKIYLRTGASDADRVSEILSFLIANKRRPNLSAAVRVAMSLAKQNEAFLAHLDTFGEEAKDGNRTTINLLPSEKKTFDDLSTFVAENKRRPIAGTIARTSMHTVPLNDDFLRAFDVMISRDKRGKTS